MVVPDTYGCPGLLHLSANYVKKNKKIKNAFPECCLMQKYTLGFLSAFQFTLAVSLKSLVLALTGPYFFSSLKTEEDIRPLYGLQVQLWDSSRQTWFVECYQRSQRAKKEGRVEGLSKEWGRRGKKGWREEIEQHRCIMCACWHTKDAVFTAGAAARHGNVPCSRLRGKMCHIYLSCSPSKEKWGTTNVPCHISGCVPLTDNTRKHGQYTAI